MAKRVIIKILDEINAVVIGLDERDAIYFYDKYGVFAKGYFFSPKFKLGGWDGKIRFFSKLGKTYVQLLEEIVVSLDNFGYDIELIDNRKSFNINVPQIDKHYLSSYPNPVDAAIPLELGDHQVLAINTATQNNIGIIKAATGAGKSIICACLCKLYKAHMNYRCLVIVPTKDLVLQTSADIALYGNDTGIYSGENKDIDHDHVVSTWQALQNNKQIATQFNVIIVDECHGVKATTIREILNEYAANAPVKLGLTGTLPDDPSEAMNVRISLGNVLYDMPAHDLIAAGWLAKLNLKVLQLEEDFTAEWEKFQENYPEQAKDLTYAKFKDEFFAEYADEMNYLKKNEDRNKFIVNLVEVARQARGNCLVLVTGIAYGKKLASMIPGAYFIHGQDKDAVRQEIYKMFAENDDVVLVTSFQIGSTGLNIRRIFNMFIVDAERSFIRVIQSIGRGLRKASDKDKIFVYDIGSDLKSSKKQCAQRKKHYKKEKYDFTFEKIKYKKT